MTALPMVVDVTDETIRALFTVTASLVGSLIMLGVGYLIVLARRRAAEDKRREAKDHERDRKVDRLLAVWEGLPADPLAGRPATLGVLGQLDEIRSRVAELRATVAAQSVRIEALEQATARRDPA